MDMRENYARPAARRNIFDAVRVAMGTKHPKRAAKAGYPSLPEDSPESPDARR
jgi:hypothetical protein